MGLGNVTVVVSMVVAVVTVIVFNVFRMAVHMVLFESWSLGCL